MRLSGAGHDPPSCAQRNTTPCWRESFVNFLTAASPLVDGKRRTDGKPFLVMHQPVAGRTETSEIARIIGAAARAGHYVVNFEIVCPSAPRLLAFVSIVGQNLTPGRRWNRSRIAFLGPTDPAIDPAIAFHSLQLGLSQLQFASAGGNRRFLALRALVNMKLCRRP